MTNHDCKPHHMKTIEGGLVCAICGNYYPGADPVTMDRPAMVTIKKPIDPTVCMAAIVTNMVRITDLRSRGISYRAITERLNLGMNHTTLQKHFSRITAGLPQMKRGRKPTVRGVAAC